MVLHAWGRMERAHTTLRFERFEEGANSVSRGQDGTEHSFTPVSKASFRRRNGDGIQLGQRSTMGP